MNITIEKIANGFVVTIDGKKTFCDVPEAICGMTSELILKTCENATEYGQDIVAKQLAKWTNAQVAAQNVALAQTAGQAAASKLLDDWA